MKSKQLNKIKKMIVKIPKGYIPDKVIGLTFKKDHVEMELQIIDQSFHELMKALIDKMMKYKKK